MGKIFFIGLLLSVKSLFCLDTDSKNLTDTTKAIDHLLHQARETININPVKSRSYAKKALAISIKKQSTIDIARSQHILGVTYNMSAQFDSASYYMFKALTSFKKLQEEAYVAETKIGIGSIYFMTYDYSEALRIWKESLTYYNSVNDSMKVGSLYYNIGNIHTNKMEYKKALKNYSLSKSFLSNQKDSMRIGRLQQAIAFTYIDLGMLDSALVYEHLSLKTAYAINDIYGLNQLYMLLGRTYRKLNLPDSAKYYLKKGLNVDPSIQSPDVTMYLYGNLSKVYELQDSNKLALKHLKKYIELNENYAPKEIEKKIHIAEKKYLTEINELKERASQAEIKNKNYLIFVLVSILIFMIITITLLINRNKIIKRYRAAEKRAFELDKIHLENKLKLKNKELVSKVMFVGKQTGFINKIYNRLKTLPIKNGSDVHKEISTILSEIKITQVEYSWKEFEKLFLEINQDFYTKLLKKYPKLSKNERRLCAFLWLNMSTKDIAEITFQSTRAINVARYRLRKKMGLSRDESFMNTFSEFLNG